MTVIPLAPLTLHRRLTPMHRNKLGHRAPVTTHVSRGPGR